MLKDPSWALLSSALLLGLAQAEPAQVSLLPVLRTSLLRPNWIDLLVSPCHRPKN